MALDRILGNWSNHPTDHRPGTLYELESGPCSYAGKPDCFVNESGDVLREWIQSLDVDPRSILVVYDDFSLDIGTLRLRPSGSDGGHRGLGSIIDRLGTQEIPRLRIGIGPIPSSEDPADFVLSPMTDTDRKHLHRVTQKVPEILKDIDRDGFDRAMNEWNGEEIRARR